MAEEIDVKMKNKNQVLILFDQFFLWSSIMQVKHPQYWSYQEESFRGFSTNKKTSRNKWVECQGDYLEES